MDGLARAVTVTVILTVIVAMPLVAFMPRFFQIITGLFIAFSMITLSAAYVIRPIGYGMNVEGLTLYFRWMRIRVPWHTVREVRVDPTTGPYRPLRTLGSGGVFGYLGRYWSPALGHHLRLVTDRRKVVVLDRKIPYCLSPDKPQQFVLEARAFLQAARPGVAERKPGFRSRWAARGAHPAPEADATSDGSDPIPPGGTRQEGAP